MQLRYLPPFISVFLLSMAAAAAEKPFLDQVDLFVERTNGARAYRIPALVETKKGTLIAVADARRPSLNDLPNDIALVIRRSMDRGKTWSEQKILREVKEGGIGDPSLLLDRKTGRVWCFHAYGPPGIGTFASRPGAVTGPTTMQAHAIYSDDDGATWSEPLDLTPQLKDPAWGSLFVTSGTNIQTRSGRYLLPLAVYRADRTFEARNAYSDDGGKTWKVGNVAGPGCDENRAIELGDGTILQNMRRGHHRLIARSKDGGVTHGPPEEDPALIDSICNAGLMRFTPRGGKPVVVFTNDASTKRERLTVKLSYDEGKTWPVERVLYAGPAAYSTVIALRDGTIGVFYERGEQNPYQKMTFARFNLAWLTASAKD